MKIKKLLIPLFALALLIYVAPSAHASDWVYLGQAHVDGQHDHDNIEIGKAAGGTASCRFGLRMRLSSSTVSWSIMAMVIRKSCRCATSSAGWT